MLKIKVPVANVLVLSTIDFFMGDAKVVGMPLRKLTQNSL